MELLRIENIENNKYTLSNDENTYVLEMEFYDIENIIKIGDYINISEDLMDSNYEEYATFYRFGSLDSEFGRNVYKNSNEVICLITSSKKIYLKRIYG